MTAPLSITRSDYTVQALHTLADRSKDAREARRLRAVAMVLAGDARRVVAQAQGTTVQSVRDWVVRFNAGGPSALQDRSRAGRPPKLTGPQRQAVGAWVEAGPEAGDEVRRWRLCDLAQKIRAVFRVRLSLSSVRRLLRRLGFAHVSARPLHPRADRQAQRAFRDGFAAVVRAAVPAGTAPERIEIWFQDEARAGQKGMLARVWAHRGSRPRILRDHRYGYAYLFGAARSTDPRAVGHVCARANTDEMNRHLADIAAAVAPGHHGVVILDGAGWHRSKALEIPANLTLVRLPAYSPELNPMEQVFQFLKANFLANRVFPTVEDVYTNLAEAWNRFASQPDRVASITARTWARADAPAEPAHAIALGTS